MNEGCFLRAYVRLEGDAPDHLLFRPLAGGPGFGIPLSEAFARDGHLPSLLQHFADWLRGKGTRPAPEHPLRHFLGTRFEENLAMAAEDYPERSFGELLRMARAWTLNDVDNMVGALTEARWAAHLEGICQHTNPSRNRLVGPEE